MRLNWRRFDFMLLGATLVLIVYGVTMIYSATLGVPNYEDYALRQAIYAAIGLMVMLLAAAFDYRLLTSLQWPIYLVTLAILGAVACGVFGAARICGGAAELAPTPWVSESPNINTVVWAGKADSGLEQALMLHTSTSKLNNPIRRFNIAISFQIGLQAADGIKAACKTRGQSKRQD